MLEDDVVGPDAEDVDDSDDRELDLVELFERAKAKLDPDSHGDDAQTWHPYKRKGTTNAEVLAALRAAGVLSDEPANVPDDYVYSDGTTKHDVLAAIQAAGFVEDYAFAERLRVRYNLLVCVRCANPDATVPLHNMNFDAWGSVCEPCAKLIGEGAAKRWAASLNRPRLDRSRDR